MLGAVWGYNCELTSHDATVLMHLFFMECVSIWFFAGVFLAE